jgi:hypothetical protein
VETDILKPNTGYATIERPSHPSSSKGTSDRQSSSGVLTPDHEHPDIYTEPVSEGEEDEDMDIAPAKDEDKRTGLTGTEVAEAIAFREQMLKERWASEAAENRKRNLPGKGKEYVPDEDGWDDGAGVDDADARTAFLRRRKSSSAATHEANGIGRPRAISINPLAPSSAFDETLRDRLRGSHGEHRQEPDAVDGIAEGGEGEGEGEGEDEGEGLEGPGEGGLSSGVGGTEYVRYWTAPIGKRIAVPVRIEPKVYFAAERTFLVSRPDQRRAQCSNPSDRNG